MAKVTSECMAKVSNTTKRTSCLLSIHRMICLRVRVGGDGELLQVGETYARVGGDGELLQVGETYAQYH